MHMGYKGVILLYLFVGCLTPTSQQNITHWKWMTLQPLRFTLRLGSLTLRSTACYVTVHTCILNQASCMKTKSRRRYLTPQPYPTQPKLSIRLRKFPLTCIFFPQCPWFLPKSSAMLCGPQSSLRGLYFGSLFWITGWSFPTSQAKHKELILTFERYTGSNRLRHCYQANHTITTDSEVTIKDMGKSITWIWWNYNVT